MDLSQLAALLRENGDLVLNGVSKLSLSTKLLKELNESFSLLIEEKEALSSTFQVISSSNSKTELLRDLQFLHDFVQRTLGLKIIEDSPESCDLISISKFKNLKLLEIHKLPVTQINGIQALRNQLQYIICVRCLQNLQDLFINCGGDKSQAFIWSELKEAVLSYNNLASIDNSFEYVPWLQTLDISHNSITDAQAIDCLPNLKHLNIGFNYLESVPIFKKELFRNLQILILKSNYIIDLTGLLYLDNLVTLDLSCNCLVDHQTLSPLAHLAALQWLNLEGNPLGFHPNHRSITVRYLHSNIATVKFLLDRALLSKSEKKFIGTYFQSTGKHIDSHSRREHLSSIGSNLSELTNSGSEITQIAASEMSRSLSGQRSKKIREAVISESNENDELRDDNGDIKTELVKSVNSVTSLSMSGDHIETQKKIENLRHEYGEDWLKNQGGSLMQDILGLEKFDSPRQASTPYEQEFMKHAVEFFQKPIEAVTNTVATIVNDPDRNVDGISEISANNTFVTANESFEIDDENDINVDESNTVFSDEELVEPDEEERPYLAQIKRETSEEEIFIVITNKYIKERDPLTAKTMCKWLIEIISSCEIISNSPYVVRLEFDTVRRNMNMREYILDEEEAKKFHRDVSDILSERPLSALIQVVYCCMKCCTQFSTDKVINKKDGDLEKNLPKCPNLNCGSTLVYELEEELTPTNHTMVLNQQTNNGFKPTDRPESPSDCSIASETECNPVAQIHVTAEVHINSNDNKTISVTPNCSAASVQESFYSNDDTEENVTPESNFKRYESDIEVISNPSQSSIEVLIDDPSRPGRKRSSEERRTIITPNLGTIPDVNLSVHAPMQGLTESSSSSSFTESVCTAYDSTVHTSRPSSGLGTKLSIQEEKDEDKHKMDEKSKPLQKEDDKNKSGLFSSLFDGLFSGPVTGKSEKSSEDYKFEDSENFSNIDHRIKYHLYQNIFEKEEENFVWLIKCKFINQNSEKFVEGTLVLSTNRLYILHIKDHIKTDDVYTWLIKKESFSLDKIQKVYKLLWDQGFGLEIKGSRNKIVNHLCLLLNKQRTIHFLQFLISNCISESCELIQVEPEKSKLNIHKLILSHHKSVTPNDTNLMNLSIFSKCKIEKKVKINLGVLLVTTIELSLLPDINCFLPDSETELKIVASQPINNLLEVDIEDLVLELHFFDEILEIDETWNIYWDTAENLNIVLDVLRPLWEKIFSVPFQINYKVHSE